MAEPRQTEPDSSANQSRRALIAGVAGLVAGAVASSADRTVEAGHGGGIDPQAFHLGATNFASNATTLIRSGAPNAPAALHIQAFGGRGFRAIATAGAAGEFSAGPFSASLQFNATQIALFGVGAAPVAPPAILGITGSNPAAVQSVLNAAGDFEGAGVVGVGVGNLTGIRGVALGDFPALEALGGLHVSGRLWLSGACQEVTLPRGNKDPFFLDPNVTPTCTVLTMARSDPKTTVIRWTECTDGQVTFHLNNKHGPYDIEISYVVIDCSEPQ